jgi:hypothetical protein
MNKFKIEIYDYINNQWVDYSKYALQPPKGANLLDEQLDEFEVQLTRTQTSIFYPQTEVRITLTSTSKAKYTNAMFEEVKSRCDNPNAFTFTYNSNKTITVERVINMLIASDNSTERPIGKGLYDHELYLIEITKHLESYLCDSITFTNPLEHNYTQDLQTYARFLFYERTGNNSFSSEYKQTTLYKITQNVKDNLTVYTPYNFFTNAGYYILDSTSADFFGDFGAGVYIYDQSGYLVYKQYLIRGDGVYEQYGNNNPIKISNNEWIEREISLTSLGFYEILYRSGNAVPDSDKNLDTFYAEGNISVVENRYPPKKWTITEVINRVLELSKPLRGEERPSIRLQGVEYLTETYNGGNIASVVTPYEEGTTASKLYKILSPEFSMPKMTLREQLQQVGGFIHGEPRITGKSVDNDGNEYFILDFDFYGQKAFSSLENKPWITLQKNININDYCTSLDSSADNLVNQLDFANGVIVEPFTNGKKTVRSETVSIRIEENDGTAYIETLFPIFSHAKLFAFWQGVKYDLTPYLFEKTDYNNLSSYEGTFPYAKAYALYYTQGEQGIRGLFFKNPNAINSVFSKYAISNILSTLTGQDLDFTTSNGQLNTDSLLDLTFQVEYLPISAQRINTNKSIVIKGLPRTLAYNQSANMIEGRYYGENLKGVVARLGNVEKQITYALPFISDIPKEGLKFNDEYYISAVSTEYLPTYCKCTVGLTKNFNRQSEHIGINSIKRMWEVSERQTQDRQTILVEYALIQEYQNGQTETSDVGTLFAKNLIKTLFNSTTNNNTNVCSLGLFSFFTKRLNPITNYSLALPVVSSSFGNSLSFTCRFEDNYSAGKRIVNENNNAYSAYSQYTDYYGRGYFVNFNLINSADVTANANNLPVLSASEVSAINFAQDRVVYTSFNKRYLRYRKDNREIPTITYELQAVTDGSVIIGSALMRNCSLVNRTPKEYLFVTLSKPLNAISSEIDISSVVSSSTSAFIGMFDEANNRLNIPYRSFENHTAWAIITKGESQTLRVVDDNGNEVEQVITTGNELVIGQNKPANGQKIAFYLKKDVYSKT